MRAGSIVTGGAGYIGSHAVLALLQAGHDVVALDNLSNSSPEALARVAQLAGHVPFVRGDVLDAAVLRQVFAQYRFDAVLHFAGLKAVGESVRQPLCYDHNASGTLALSYRMAPRRAGDVARCWCDPTRARQELGWQVLRGLPEMMADAWRWQSCNPQGMPGHMTYEGTLRRFRCNRQLALRHGLMAHPFCVGGMNRRVVETGV